MSKRVQKVWNAVTTVLVILVVILALLLVGVRLVGLRPMCVLSGSMEPTYHTGSLIYVKPCAPEDVQVGDAITFVLNEDLDVVTHRVISIDAENEHFYTQGDANDAPDGAPVYFKNLIGRPVFTIPYLGYVSHWVSNPPGMYLAIALALVLIILTFRPDAPITRAEFATIAARFYHAPEVTGDAFSDISGSWAREYINRAAARGLIDGYEDGTFRPNQNIKRDEAMKIINKVLFRTPDKEHFLPDMIKWPDNSNTDAWYYTDVQEATNNHDYERVNNTSPETWTKITPARDWKALEAELAQKYPNR